MNSNVVDVLRQEITPAVQDRDILISAQLIMSGINTLALVPEKYLRDYFAGLSMAALLQHGPVLRGFGKDEAGMLQDVSAAAYEMADAMLAAREKKA